MKKLMLAMLCILNSLSVHAYKNSEAKGLYCGTRGTFLGVLASDVAIPDYFPPEKFLPRMLLSPFYDLALCEDNFAPVHLGFSCKLHDQCYNTLGARKDDCDDNLLANWRNSCKERYNNNNTISLYCLESCESVVDLMNKALRYNDGYLCPSCQAFTVDQERARNLSN